MRRAPVVRDASGISRFNLYELIDKYKIRTQEFKMIRAAGKSEIKSREVS